MDPVTAYQVANAAYNAYKGGRFVAQKVDKKVAEYAEQNGMTKEEVWAQVGAEAARHGDKALEAMASNRGQLVMQIALGPVLGPIAGFGARKLRDRRGN